MKKFPCALAVFLLIFSACAPAKPELTITIPLVTWGGYASLFAANGGAEPSENSLFYKYGKFKVKLVQQEDPSLQLQGFSSGTYGIIWSTMDMLPLLYDSLSKDPRSMPRVIGAFDYSAGGDGIITRGGIKDASGLKGKRVTAAQFTPSHYFLLWYLSTAGLTQNDIVFVPAGDAIVAKDTFINDKTVDACVTWSPFIYDITDSSKPTYVTGSSLLATSEEGGPAYGLIADVYVASAKLMDEYPGAMDAFAKAMNEGYELFLKDREKTAAQIAALFGLAGGAAEVMVMFDDVVIAGPQENAQFFDKTLPVSGYAIYDRSTDLYKKSGILPASFTVTADKVMWPGPMATITGK